MRSMQLLGQDYRVKWRSASETVLGDGTKRVLNPCEILQVGDLTGPGRTTPSVANRVTARVRWPVDANTQTLFQAWIWLGLTLIQSRRLYSAHDLVTPMAGSTLIRIKGA